MAPVATPGLFSTQLGNSCLTQWRGLFAPCNKQFNCSTQLLSPIIRDAPAFEPLQHIYTHIVFSSEWQRYRNAFWRVILCVVCGVAAAAENVFILVPFLRPKSAVFEAYEWGYLDVSTRCVCVFWVIIGEFLCVFYVYLCAVFRAISSIIAHAILIGLTSLLLSMQRFCVLGLPPHVCNVNYGLSVTQVFSSLYYFNVCCSLCGLSVSYYLRCQVWLLVVLWCWTRAKM